MAHTNSTENYGLPQWIGTDKPTFLGDFNSAFGTIDSALKTNSDNATSALNTANSADAVATSANTNAGTALSTANQALTDAQSAQTTASQAVSTANTASSKADSALRASAGNSIENLAPAYDNTLTYHVGDLVTYIDAQNSGKLYKCILDVNTPMDFNINYWDDVTTSEVYAQISGGTSIEDVVDMITPYVESTAIASRAYAVGDYFILNSVLYKATQAITIGGAIVPDTNCTTTTATNEIKSSFDEIDAFKYRNPITNIAPYYDETATYSIGDIVSYIDGNHVGKVFKCIADITSAEVFTPAHWTEINVSNTFKPVIILNTLNSTASDTWREVIRYLTRDYIDQLSTTAMIEMDDGANKVYYRLDTITGHTLQFSHVAMSASALVVYTIGANDEGGVGSRYSVTVSSSGASFTDDSLGLTGVATFKLYK